MNRALIVFAQADGTLLAIRAEDAHGTLAQTLATRYAHVELARNLVELGDLVQVGLTIDACVVDDEGEEAADLSGAWDLECHRAGIASVHIFEHGAWRHETDAWITEA